MTVQIGDINYGGHAGNERYLLFAQETRLRFLETIGCSEMKFGDYGLVLAEATLEYFHELFSEMRSPFICLLEILEEQALDAITP